MTSPSRFARGKARIEKWFTAPEPNAAGNLGIFRIVYCLFYLWHLSGIVGANFSGVPAWARVRILLVHLIPADVVTPGYMSALESVTAAAVVFLMFGYRTRIATALVLVTGALFEAHLMTFSTERGGVMLVFFIPFFMFLANTWGMTYSLDSLSARRTHSFTVDVHDSRGEIFYPARAMLVVLVALFVSAAAAKVGPNATWFPLQDMLGNQVLMNNVHGAVQGFPSTPIPSLIARTPPLEISLRYLVIVVEALPVIALVNRAWRNVVMALLVLFHAGNALVLFVTFTPILIVYGAFVNWQALRDRFVPTRATWVDHVPTPVLTGGAFILAVGTGLAWNAGTVVRDAAGLWGLLDWRTIWIPIVPAALVWLFVATRALIHSLRKRTAVTV